MVNLMEDVIRRGTAAGVRSRYQSPRVLARVLGLVLRKRLRDLAPARWLARRRSTRAEEHDLGAVGLLLNIS